MNSNTNSKVGGGKNGFAPSWLLLALLGFAFLVGNLSAANNSAVVALAAASSQDEIQAALDQAPQGGEVVLAPGTYQIHRPLMLRRDHLTLRGSGPATVLHLVDRANCPVVILGSPMAAVRRTTSHLRLADLDIDGNRLNQEKEFWHSALDGSQLNNNGIDVWAVDDSTVVGVVCRSCRSGGLVTAEARRLNVSDFTAYDNQFDGLACYFTEESRFTGLHLHDNLAAGISLDLSFNHNVIADADLTANDLGVFMRDSRDNVFQDLTITKSRNHGVFMAQTGEALAGGWRLCPGTECTGNKFEGLTITHCGGKGFLINDSSCTDNTITGAHYLANTHGDFSQPAAPPAAPPAKIVAALLPR